MFLRSALLAFSLALVSSAFAWNTPSQGTPANGAVVWTGLTLDWSAVSASEAYQVQVDTSSAFNSPLLYSATKAYINSSSMNADTQEPITNLRFGTTYRWRVRAYVTGDTSAWSPTWTFNTRDFVVLSDPASGSLTWTGLTMDWGAHTGVGFYDAQLDTSASFNSPVSRSATNNYINSNDMNADTQWSVDDLFFGKTYYWRVRARNAVDTSAWSTVWTFTTRSSVNLSDPASNSLTWTGLTMDWGAHTGVGSYDAQLDTSANFNSPVIRSVTTTYINSNGMNADTQWSVDDLYFGKTYHWRVRARNAVDTSAWSTVWTFNTRDFVSLVSPADLAMNQNVGGVTVDWSAHSGVDLYQLQLDTVNQFNTQFLVSVPLAYINSNSGNGDTQYSTGALLTQQVYFWRVRAINAVDTSAWTTRSFSTGNTPIVLPSAPALIAPANTSIVGTANIDLVWSAVPDVGGYEYQVSTLPDLSNAVPLLTGGTQITYGPMTVGTTYFWRARSLDAGNASDWSAIWRFTYDPSTGLSSASETALTVYPNPTADRITVLLPADEIGEIILIDANGRVAFTTRATGPVVMMDLADLPRGGYWLRVSSARSARSVAVVKQ